MIGLLFFSLSHKVVHLLSNARSLNYKWQEKRKNAVQLLTTHMDNFICPTVLIVQRKENSCKISKLNNVKRILQ